MGKIKPIGSEKLQGIDKINRIMEIARYNEHIPKPINENKSTEYSKQLADGMDYFIVKEKTGYVIKKGLNESVSDYIEPMKNRKYYNSYSQALKRLNLIAKEVNVNEGNSKNINLFYESDDEQKYYLKVPTDEQAAPAETQVSPAATTPAPAPEPAPVPTSEVPSETMPEPEMEPEEELTPEPEMEPEGEDIEEKVSLKSIQKLTGKLGQKIRQFYADEDNQMTSKDIKYVINSILSALNLDSLDEEDKEEIIGKFESEEEGMEDMGGEMEDMSGEMEEPMSDETPTPETEPSMETEMGEDYESIRHRRMGSRRLSDRRMDSDDTSEFEEMLENIFSESKVENVIKSYFINEEKTKNHGKKIENTKKIIKKIKSLSESISQEVASRKFVQSNPEANLVGKTKNNNLVFKLNESTVRISPKGNIL